MTKYLIILGKSQKKLEIETSLSVCDVLLLIVQNYGEEWYGCRIYGDGFAVVVPEKEAYSIIDENKTVYEWAIERHNRTTQLCINNRVEVDTLNPFKEV